MDRNQKNYSAAIIKSPLALGSCFIIIGIGARREIALTPIGFNYGYKSDDVRVGNGLEPIRVLIPAGTRAASFRRFGGIGVRYGLDGSWAYTTSFGNVVEIVPKQGRTFVFSSNNPEQVCQIINTKTQALA